ncbi:nonsense-mediated mRNA decay factor SMG8-like isoform X2 [Liolophura sinensis]|uniref:nonsense-mediated mRNA decay factor SMG8-like isoform X2 n=1 Tax=Liolophura sinensis TaxID=3198878 RepID=UPI0031584CF0
MAATSDEFVFPPKLDSKYFPGKDEKVCVVSILGKSAHNGHNSKASIINHILDRDVFQGYPSCKDSNRHLEYFHDTDSRVVYLHHWSSFDTARLIKICQNISQDQDIHSNLLTEDLQHAKTLLFLFSVSHLVLLNHPGTTFDVSYIHLFNSINTIRLKWQPFVSEVLSEFALPKDWVSAGRPCSPRVLFVFSDCVLESDPGKPQGQRGPSVRRHQHAIEDQIYSLLRKARTITNISNNSLFAVPANQEFVYIHTKDNELADPLMTYLSQMKSNCPIRNETESPRSRGYQMNRHGNQKVGMGDNSAVTTMQNGHGERRFKEFLEQHIVQALTKGFDDNVGRHPIPALFELCTCEVWFTMATCLYQMMFSLDLDPRLRGYFNTLKSLLETDVRFSENRCSKVLPVAESTYQDGLPPHYTESYHQSKLAQARRVFCQHARGPCFKKYLVQLEEACEKWWKNGHQLCEAISLTGNHCVNRLHSAPGESTEGDLEEMPHCSQFKTRASCNCGQTQADREDPFDHKAANYDFYCQLEEQCCHELKRIELPVFHASTSEIRAGKPASSETPTTEPQSSLPKTDLLTSGMASLSLALSLDQTDIGQSMGSVAETHTDAETGGATLNLQSPTESSKPLSRQHSTVEYLPGMIHTSSPSGLLPTFPSWSVCCLGKASAYNTTQGLDQQGFLPGSNFLLPWDIPITAEKEKWPTVGEGVMRKGKQRRTQKEASETTLRAYLGMEYECPRGHRFFCSGPEKIIKVSSTSTVKDNANKLLSMDMPLYCPCHCRSSKGFMAQLMRVFVVTPEGPLSISVDPKVRPCPPPCPVFHPGTGPIELTAGAIWVIRLPFVYLGSSGAYTMPSDPDQLIQCRLLQGMFNYTDLSQAQDT